MLLDSFTLPNCTLVEIHDILPNYMSSHNFKIPITITENTRDLDCPQSLKCEDCILKPMCDETSEEFPFKIIKTYHPSFIEKFPEYFL